MTENEQPLRERLTGWLPEWVIGHGLWQFTGEKVLAYLAGGISIAVLRHLPWYVWLTTGLGVTELGFIIAEKVRTGRAVKLNEIPFDYLPNESPLSHRWEWTNEGGSASPPSFSALAPGSPIPVGLSITPTGWYGMDYRIREAHTTTCNQLRFAANFATDGKLYALVRMTSREVGRAPEERWIQMGVNIGPPRIEGNEAIVSISGKRLRDGWISFNLSLDDLVGRTHGRRGFLYGNHGKLLRIRLRGALSISPIEFYRL